MRVHADHRRTAWCDLFPTLPGDLNVFSIKKGQATYWHRHQHQTDRFFVARGAVRFQWWNGDSRYGMTLYPGDEPVTIPAGYWHGYKALEPSLVVMYLDQKFSPADEEHGDPAVLGVQW